MNHTYRIALITALTAICGTQPAWAAASVTGTGDLTPGSPTSPVWAPGTILRVGGTGIGTLNIEDGGKVSNHNGTIGYNSGGIGTVTVAGGGSSWTNTGILYVGGTGTGTLSILSGGKVSSETTVISFSGGIGTVTISGTDSIWTNTDYVDLNYNGGGATINIGAASVLPGDATSPGTLKARSILFRAGSDAHGTSTLNFNHTGSNYVFATPLVSYGTGAKDSLNHYAGTTLLTGDSSGFKGTTTVVGGTLVVGVGGVGKLGGMLTVGNGATLQGTGSVGTTTLQSGAMLAPGNSIGTLTVAGDLRFLPGAIYRVEADPDSSSSDRVAVTGTAHLAGSVIHVGPEGGFASMRQYTILSANAVQGQFDSVRSNYAYLDPTLRYGAQDVTLQLERKLVPVDPVTPPTRPIAFADAAQTGNQRATANGLDSLAAGDPLHEFILTLPAGAPPAVFDNLSGEIHASVASSLLGAGVTARTLPLAHLRANLGAGMQPGALLAQAGGALPASALPKSNAQPAWAEVVGNWQTLQGDSNAAEATQRTGGVFIGADHAIGGGWRVGAALGYTEGKTRVDERASTADVSSYSAALYGGRAFDVGAGKLNFLAGTAYAWHNLNTERYATVSKSSQKLTADYGANTTQLFTELGYAMPLSERVTVEPFAGLAWSRLRTRGFSESGGSAALSGQPGSDAQTNTTLGLRAQTGFTLGQAVGQLRATLGWRHAFGDVTPQSTLAFQGGQAFTVAGAPIARDAALTELGIDIAVARHASLGLSYSGQFGGGNREQTGSLNVRWRY